MQETDGGYCHRCEQPLEIASLHFSFLKHCKTRFACSSCDKTLFEKKQKPKRAQLWQLNHYRWSWSHVAGIKPAEKAAGAHLEPDGAGLTHVV
jgi:hypothetical protein